MQYVRSLGSGVSSLGSGVSKTWNSINPATLSGAIDVIVIEQPDGTLACSPFHVRFGKFSLLRPYEKKVEFKVNGIKQDFQMKLGEGGEAFFIFETTDAIPEALQTSPLVSPENSPPTLAASKADTDALTEPTYLDIAEEPNDKLMDMQSSHAVPIPRINHPDAGDLGLYGGSFPGTSAEIDPSSWPDSKYLALTLEKSASETVLPLVSRDNADLVSSSYKSDGLSSTGDRSEDGLELKARATPPGLKPIDAIKRAMTLSKKLSTSNIRSEVTETGDLMLDMTGYKTSEEDALRAEAVARRLLSEELEGNYDIGSLIGTDDRGNLWIYSSEEARDAALRKAAQHALAGQHVQILTSDSASDPGYHSDTDRSVTSSPEVKAHQRIISEELPGKAPRPAGEQTRNFAKTLRLTSDQLRQLNLRPGINPVSFTVNRATCPASMFYWSYDVPIVISDIDGTITKSDALGHLLNMVGRDWTHVGVAKLYTDIVANGYNILYLTSRSVGQADTTRTYLSGVKQEGWQLPKGPVIMSPDRTIAALRREIYLRKPEVFKMAALRDVLSLFPGRNTPFYAGFGNRFTDALSYRTVNIPSSRIFTINSNAEVSLDMLTLNRYRSSYVTMRELVDQFFPPVSTLVREGGEQYTDFAYWKDNHDLDDFIPTDSEADDDEDEEDEDELDERDQAEVGSGDDYEDSYRDRRDIDQSSLDESLRESVEFATPIDASLIIQQPLGRVASPAAI